MMLRDKMNNLRARLTPKQATLFRLVLWCLLMVWMVLFLTHTIITARVLAGWAPQVFGNGVLQQGMAHFIPVFYVVVICATIYIIIRWANRRLREGKK